MKYTAAVITVSDKGAAGQRTDTSGPALCALLKEDKWDVVYTNIIPDEQEQIKAEIVKCADEQKVNLILTTGGTGLSPRDVTPEATLAVIDRTAPGIPEAMREESMRITPKGCLSRSTAGVRGNTLIINLPGSEKAAKENIRAIFGALKHGVDMIRSAGSADCAETEKQPKKSLKKTPPSVDAWLSEAKKDPNAAKIGMYLTHNGTVRQTARAKMRHGVEDASDVVGMHFDYDAQKVNAAIAETYQMEGIYYVRVWLNSGELEIGDDIMYVLIGGDIRPHVVDALQTLVGKIKSDCVVEIEKTEKH
jgi:molybdopterin adenylyltransferase